MLEREIMKVRNRIGRRNWRGPNAQLSYEHEVVPLPVGVQPLCPPGGVDCSSWHCAPELRREAKDISEDRCVCGLGPGRPWTSQPKYSTPAPGFRRHPD